MLSAPSPYIRSLPKGRRIQHSEQLKIMNDVLSGFSQPLGDKLYIMGNKVLIPGMCVSKREGNGSFFGTK